VWKNGNGFEHVPANLVAKHGVKNIVSRVPAPRDVRLTGLWQAEQPQLEGEKHIYEVLTVKQALLRCASCLPP
jgi:hypothetical protein